MHAAALQSFRDTLMEYPVAEAARERVEWFSSVVDYVIGTKRRLILADEDHEEEAVGAWWDAITRLHEGCAVLADALGDA